MEFINKLVESGRSYRFRMMKSLQVNEGISLSIQASEAHYCSPRQTVDVLEYTSMELGVFRDNEFISVRDAVDDSNLIDEFEKYFEGTVYAYVPVELLEQLYQKLKIGRGV